MASKILSLCKKRIQQDWIDHFGFPLLLMETFVDPSRFTGTIYKAASWHFAGVTKGYQRIQKGYSNTIKILKWYLFNLLNVIPKHYYLTQF